MKPNTASSTDHRPKPSVPSVRTSSSVTPTPRARFSARSSICPAMSRPALARLAAGPLLEACTRLHYVGAGSVSDVDRGIVYLVGAGPGDPGLMTRRSLELVAEADVVLYDRLIPPGALEGARADAELRYVGKEPGAVALSQEETNELLVELGRAGKRVVRLKGGDPFVFGRGGEEAEALAAAGVPFEVVPGV